MDAETLDLIVRSRPTILEILENRGYNISSYKNTSPDEILHMAITSSELLRIYAGKQEDSNAPLSRAVVLYWVDASIRLRIEPEMMKLFDPENPNHLNAQTDDIMIVLSEPFHEMFHVQALKQWNSQKAHIGFFQIKNLISNPAKHIMVPPHRKLSQPEIDVLMAGLHLRAKSELPHIKFHVDMQARVLGLVPGDIVEIKRPSETAGEAVIYRYCSA